MKKGNLVISLDFELFWGVCDVTTVEKFRKSMDGGREGIPKLLKLFDKYSVHATWGTVGILFARSKEELNSFIPSLKPVYEEGASPYEHLKDVGENEQEDPYHFAPSLIKEILSYPDQEIGSHTFSHYYCKDEGQNRDTFEADLKFALSITKETCSVTAESIIFPRNQYNREYIPCLKENGIIALRGNPKSFAYNGGTPLCRILRLIDTYIPVCGKKYYDKSECLVDGIADIKASIFFRKYNHRLRFLEGLKMHSIKKQMKKAAKKGKVLHIWWHPHNMGENLPVFLSQMEEILAYYKMLNERYGFESKTMGELAKEIIHEEC